MPHSDGSKMEVLVNDNDHGYESGRESGSDAHAAEFSDSASSPDEDMELWARNIRAEIELNPGSVDENTVMQYWGDLCLEPAGEKHGEQIEERTVTSPQLLDTKITVGELLLRAAPPQHPYRPFLLFHLSDNLGRRFRYSGLDDLEDLNRAIEVAAEGVRLFRETPPVGPEQSVDITAMGLLNLGTLLLARYESTKIWSDLESAITQTKSALELMENTSSHLPAKLTAYKNLPLMLVLRCQWTRSEEDLDQAYKMANEGLRLAKEARCPDERIVGYQWLLSISCETRYQHGGDIRHLSEAINLAKAVVANTSAVPDKKVSYLRYLGVMLHLRFAATSNLRDAEAAIKYAEDGLKIGPPTPEISHPFFRLLSDLHEAKYHARGDPQDLDKSLSYRKQAIETSGRGDAKAFIGLAGLVISLRPRYLGVGALDDVNDSLEMLEASIDDNMDMRERTHFISSLGALYEGRYNLTSTPGDLDRAVSMSEASIAFLPRNSPELPRFQGELARRLQLRYRARKRMEDLEAAIAWGAQAMTEEPSTSIHRPSLLHCLSQSLSFLYLESGDPNDLDFALSIGSDAAEEFPEYHPEFAPAMINLGELFFGAYLAEQIEEEKSTWLYWALQFFMSALQCPSAIPRSRLNAAGQAAKMHMVLARLVEDKKNKNKDDLIQIQEHWQNAYEILSEVVGLLPVLSIRKLTAEDQQWHCSQHLSLASNAASMAIKSGKPALEAARLLETGRGIIMGNLIEYRHGISGLERAYPDLAREFDVLRKKVDGMYDDGDVHEDIRASLLFNNQQEKRNRDYRLLESVLQKIRGMPGFETFLSPSESEFKEAAKHGPIVMINVTEASSDAIIIRSTGVSSLPLPHLSSNWAKTQIGMIHRNILKSREQAPDKNRRMRALLEMLWVAVVKPVLQELGIYNSKQVGNNLPHVWWIGVGIMARAPFHAAGCYPKSPNSSKADYASKYCISSYTPTVISLLYSRAREGAKISKTGIEDSTNKLLFITMPKTPGDKDLPIAQEEAESIISFLPSNIIKTLLISPTSKLALEKIRGHNMVHFACHGITELANPSKSRVLLLKGPREVETLTVKEISVARPFQQLHPSGIHNLAYLSACIYADDLSEDLAEEVLHIASGFQLAGFSHVVGTMWMGEDTVSKRVAEEFYKALFNCGGIRGDSRVEADPKIGDPAAAAVGSSRSPDGERVSMSRVTCAEALHRAVDKVKIVEGYWWNPLDWAQFCHWGA